MPNPIKYNSSTEDNALNVGNFWIGTGDVDKGPTSITGYYNGITPPPNGYTIYVHKLNQGPSIRIASDDSELIEITNHIAGTTYTTIIECFNYFEGQSDKMVTHQTMNFRITDNLSLDLDGNNIPSYPHNGTTWHDLSGGINNATLINSPTFNNNGWIDFDGSDDYASITNTNLVPGSVTSLTIGGLWKRNGNGGSYETVLHQSTNTTIGASSYWFGYDVNNFITVTIGARNGVGWAAGQTSINADIGKWFYTAASWDGSNVYVYVNGELIKSYSLSTYSNPGTITRIGASGNATGYLANVGVSNIHINPNKSFSQSEILQNYYQAPIVTDGLVFAIDAGNLVSYENGDTTTYSLTGSSTGTLTNGVAFNSGYGGVWEFDGTDDYITLPSSIATALNGGEEASLNMWVKLNSNSNSVANTGIIQLSGYSNGNGNLYWYQNGYTYLDIFITTRYRVWINTVLDPRNWHMLTITTTSGTNGWKAYLNGILQFQTTGQSTVSVNSTIVGGLTLGENSNGRYTNGNIASCFIYDKALTSDEVSKNYHATKYKFGHI